MRLELIISKPSSHRIFITYIWILIQTLETAQEYLTETQTLKIFSLYTYDLDMLAALEK